MRLLLISFLSVLLLSASDVNHQQVRILEKIITEISIDKEISVWSDNKIILDELTRHGKLKITDNCTDANILILEKKENLINECKSKHIFVLNYNFLTNIPQSFGALFWKKGRPNIVIIESRITTQNIRVSKNLNPYLEEKVW